MLSTRVTLVLTLVITATLQFHSHQLKSGFRDNVEIVPEQEKRQKNLIPGEDIQKTYETLESRIFEYTVRSGDCLHRIAKRFGLTSGIIEILNPQIKDHFIFTGQKLRLFIVTDPPYILVDTEKNTLSLYIDEILLKLYSISTGRGGSYTTPKGEFIITDIVWNPYDYEKKAPSGHPDNRFGSAWIGLNIPKFGIHGTNDSSSIGDYSSEGCARMLNDDVRQLAMEVSIGMQVRIK
jgi:lipoprotein-anchoring transpeptidase ErfK/SrfK